MPTYKRYKPGDEVLTTLSAAATTKVNLKPGDVGFVYDHKPSIVHEAIWARERAEAGKDNEWSNLTHMFCVLDSDGTIIEALSEGMMVNNVSKYRGMDYWVVNVDATDEQRELCVERWRKQEGLKYSKITFVTEAFLCWGIPLRLGWGNEFICSGLAGFGMLAYVVSFPQPFEEQTPFDIAQSLELPIDSPIRPLSFMGRILNRIVFVGRLFMRIFKK